MKKKREKSGFLSKDLPIPQNVLLPKPEFSQLVGHDVDRKVYAFRQEPPLQHALAVEGKRKRKGGIKLNVLYSDQYPFNHLPENMRDTWRLLMNAQSTMPSMTNYPNASAPTPMSPQDRPI
jgi:hypothetical protein